MPIGFPTEMLSGASIGQLSRKKASVINARKQHLSQMNRRTHYSCGSNRVIFDASLFLAQPKGDGNRKLLAISKERKRENFEWKETVNFRID